MTLQNNTTQSQKIVSYLPDTTTLAIASCSDRSACANIVCKQEKASLIQKHLHIIIGISLIPIFIAIYFLSYCLRFDGQLNQYSLFCFQTTVGWVVLTKLAWFVGLRVCRGWNRLVTFYDLSLLVRAATAGSLTVAFICHYIVPLPYIPRSVLMLDWGATIVVIGGLRALLRGWREMLWLVSQPVGQVRVLIVGIGDAGALMLRSVRQSGRQNYRAVGFICSDEKMIGSRIEGVPIVGTIHHASKLAEKYAAQQILVIQGEVTGEELRHLVDQSERHGFEVRVLPSYKQLIDGSFTLQPRQVSIEDLLQRKPVELDIDDIRHWVDGQTVLVTGSAGSIGSEICRQLLHFSPRRILAVDRSETGQFFLEKTLENQGDVKVEILLADILDEGRMREIFHRFRPDVIFHAAAYKHVPLMESHPGEAVKNIVTSTRKLAELAMVFNVGSFVMISTDKAVNPTNVMGACKRTAELFIQSLSGRSKCRFVTVRFGNVLDSAGSVVQVFRQQIAAGGPITVTHSEIRRFFMTIPEAARLVIQAGAIGEDGQILLLDMGEPVRIIDLAADMIRLSGLQVGTDIDIKIVGLRPGEKMFEELHTTGEERLATSHPKIIVAKHKHPQSGDLLQHVGELERLAHAAPMNILSQLQKIVPEYHISLSTIPFSNEFTVVDERRIAA